MVPSFTCSLGRLCFALSAVAVSVCLWSGAARAQKIDQAKLDTAVRRSGKAAKVLTDVSALPPGETIPRELFERAQAIAVFPDVDKINLLFQKAMKGHGVMSRRVPGGWTAPAFYTFGMHDIGWTRIKSEEPNLILLFMSDGILQRFEKDAVRFSEELIGKAGPVGELTPEKEKKIQGADIIIYALEDGKLRGMEVEDESPSGSAINSDNKINKAIYGLKAREILSGKTPAGPAPPPALNEFQSVLTRLSKQ
jgi:lipid-binding SYLF domain-containing protein